MFSRFPIRNASISAVAPAKTSLSRSPVHRLRKTGVILLMILEIFIFCYMGIMGIVAICLEYPPPLPITKTPAAYGLNYRDITFYSREDHIRLRGWFIPGVLPDRQMTTQRTVIMVHGTGSNRASPLVLSLSSALARRGFAILAFDLRGMGQSDPAPLSEGYFEQRDVLGAVDFLHTGQLPYPELGRPRFIAGWGDSMGAATMLLAAAHEPAIRAIVSDSGFAALVPLLQSDTQVPGMFIPSVLSAVDILYRINFYALRP